MGFEGLYIYCIGFNHSECVVCNAEKKFIVECSIDQTEKIGFPRLHLEFECICMHEN